MSSSSTSDAAEVFTLAECIIHSVKDGRVEEVCRGPLRVMLVNRSATGRSTPATANAEMKESKGETLTLLVCGATFGYPLINQPILRASHRQYILPADATLHYAISIGNAVSESEISEFDMVVRNVAEVRNRVVNGVDAAATPDVAPPDVVSSTSTSTSASAPAQDAGKTAAIGDYMSAGILYTGQALASGAVVAAQYTGWGLRRGAAALTSYLYSAEQLEEEEKKKKAAEAASGKTVETATSATSATAQAASPTLQSAHSALATAKWVSSGAVKVSSALVAGANAIARTLGAGISEGLKNSSYGKSISDATESETGKAVKAVALASLTAVVTVWDGLEKAAIIVGTDVSAATKQVVHHRYGEETSVVVSKGLDVAADLGVAALNMNRVGPKAILKQTALHGTKNILVGTPEELKQAARSPTGVLAAAQAASVTAVMSSVATNTATDRPHASLLTAAAFGSDTAALLADTVTVAPHSGSTMPSHAQRANTSAAASVGIGPRRSFTTENSKIK